MRIRNTLLFVIPPPSMTGWTERRNGKRWAWKRWWSTCDSGYHSGTGDSSPKVTMNQFNSPWSEYFKFLRRKEKIKFYLAKLNKNMQTWRKLYSKLFCYLCSNSGPIFQETCPSLRQAAAIYVSKNLLNKAKILICFKTLFYMAPECIYDTQFQT